MVDNRNAWDMMTAQLREWERIGTEVDDDDGNGQWSSRRCRQGPWYIQEYEYYRGLRSVIQSRASVYFTKHTTKNQPEYACFPAIAKHIVGIIS